MADVATDNHDRTHFGNGPPETCKPDGDQRDACLGHQRGDPARMAEADGSDQRCIFGIQRFKYLTRQGNGDGQNKNGLRKHHCGGRIEDSQKAERPGARNKQIYDQPHDNRRHAKKCVCHNDDGTAARKAVGRQHRPERQANQQ